VRAAFPNAHRDRIAFVALDVTKEQQAADAIKVAVDRFERIDVLVNNAGYSILGNFEDITTAELEQQLATNFYGVVNVMRGALPVMRRQRSGHIINVSSVAGVVGQRHCTAYGASKFAVEGLSLALAEEVGQFGINVTIVEPGFFRTDLLAERNVRWATPTVEDYAHEGSPEAMWSPYAGKQTGDPDKLGVAIVSVARMTNPPKVFAGGADALATIRPAIESRLKDMREHEQLSSSTDLAV
jgi:NAD(P)-dependent dehydrogenase (short-subunit alcohol dehydrogenase family)